MAKASPIDLNTVAIASPCTARWEDMEGDERVRHCRECALDVYDSRGLSERELRALLEQSAGSRTCLRLHRRPDGRLITRDCPIGLRRAWARLSAVAAMLWLGAVGLPARRASERDSDSDTVPPLVTGTVIGDVFDPGRLSLTEHSASRALDHTVAVMTHMVNPPSVRDLDVLWRNLDAAAVRRRGSWPRLGDALHMRARLLAYMLYLGGNAQLSSSVKKDFTSRARRDLAAARAAYRAPNATFELELPVWPWMPEAPLSQRNARGVRPVGRIRVVSLLDAERELDELERWLQSVERAPIPTVVR